MKATDIPMPEKWSDLVRKSMLHIAGLVRWNMISVHANSDGLENAFEVRHASEVQRQTNELTLCNEQIRIMQTRMDKIPAKNRPYYSPPERLAILKLKAARGWNHKQTADAFRISEETISSWMRELDIEGESSLVQTPVPVNKYPEFVEYVTQWLKSTYPLYGKKKIAEHFVRAGLFLSASTIGRRLKERSVINPDDPPPIIETDDSEKRSIISREPNHIWGVDFTAVPTMSGFWTSWSPNALPQQFPFCYWVFIIIDHFSRKVVGFSLFNKPPSAKEIVDALKMACKRIKGKPGHIISDKGSQFFPSTAKPENRKDHPYHKWCKRMKIQTRFGAVGKYGSIAIVERFNRTLKDECTRKIFVPFCFEKMREELAIFITWYNELRPHSYLDARTPEEVYVDAPPIEQVESASNSDLPEFSVRISYFEGRKHLPIVEIKKAA